MGIGNAILSSLYELFRKKFNLANNNKTSLNNGVVVGSIDPEHSLESDTSSTSLSIVPVEQQYENQDSEHMTLVGIQSDINIFEAEICNIIINFDNNITQQQLYEKLLNYIKQKAFLEKRNYFDEGFVFKVVEHLLLSMMKLILPIGDFTIQQVHDFLKNIEDNIQYWLFKNKDSEQFIENLLKQNFEDILIITKFNNIDPMAKLLIYLIIDAQLRQFGWESGELLAKQIYARLVELQKKLLISLSNDITFSFGKVKNTSYSSNIVQPSFSNANFIPITEQHISQDGSLDSESFSLLQDIAISDIIGDNSTSNRNLRGILPLKLS